MSSLMHKPTGPASQTIDAQAANLRRNATPNPAFKPEFRRSLRMHPVLAGAVAGTVFVLLVLFAMQQKAMFYAESLIYIEPFNTKVLADGTTGAFDSTKYESSVAQQMLTAQRTDIITTALQTLPRQVWAVYGPTPQAAANVLQGQMKVARVNNSYQVSIGLKGPNASNTAAIVNAVTTAYLEAGRKDEISQADQRSQLLSEERSRIEAELQKTRAEQTRLGATLGVAEPGVGGTNPFDSQLDALRQQLVQARSSHDQAAAQLAAISGVNGSHASGLDAAANDVINGDAGLSSMKSTINQRRAELSSKMAGLTPGNPIYKADQDELADLDKTLDTMTVQLRDRAKRSLQDKLRTELERTSDVEARLNAELARQTANATSASPRLQRAQELQADVQRLTTRYSSVDNALHSLQLETSGPGMAHLALAAAVPSGPEPSKKRLILLAALPVALLCGLLAAVFARKRDTRIYTAGDVDEVLGFAPIAILPARGEVSSEVLDEYYLRLAAGVEGAYRSGNARTFVVTPVSSETEIVPLMTALDRKLVELGLGVVVLRAESVFESHAQAEGEEGYDRHFEGIAPAMFARMKTEHDVILLHAPALLVSAQTEYVARCADVTLLVVESAVTTRGELYQAGVLLQRLNVTGVGAVLEEMQLRYANSTFAKGVKTLEGRSRPVRQERPLAQAEAVAEVPVAVAEAETPLPAERMVWEEPHISAGPPSAACYPDDAVITPEVPVLESHAEPVMAAVSEPEPKVDFQEREQPAPMAMFDSVEPSPEREKRSWFQRMFARESTPVVSIIPDDEDEDEPQPEPVAATVFDASRYDLPLPVEEPAPVQASAVQVVEEPLPEPLEPSAPALAPTFVEPDYAEDLSPEPVLAAPVAAWEPATPVYAFEPEAVAEPVRPVPVRPLSFLELTQLREPEPVALQAAPEPAPAFPAPVPFQHFEAAVETFEPVPVAEREEEPMPAEVSYAAEPEPSVQYAEEVEEPVAAIPEYVAPSPIQATHAVVPAVVAPEPAVSDEWNPAPLNRWDPIPPLRPQEEPWRVSSGSRLAQGQAAREVWRGEDPVRIPPADRWVAPETLSAEAPPAESNDVVLTRRWGLLSRFQQGESFQSQQSARRAAPRTETEPEQYAQDFGQDYDPEYDRPRR